MNWIRATYGIDDESYSRTIDVDLDGIVDPSGYIYEAVLSNKLEGAEAIVWQKQTLYNMYDEPYEDISQWDAQAYGQTNPQMTNAAGEFGWDVPDGTWQVRVSKPGYEDSSTEWMTVPPEHKDMHIGLVSNNPPEVKQIKQKMDGIEVTFSQYMTVASLNNAFSLVCDGVNMPLTVNCLDTEKSPGGVQLATKALLTSNVDINAVSEGTLTISNNVTSYAGIAMEENETYVYNGVAPTISVSQNITLLKGASTDVIVSTTPYDYFEGKTLLAIAEDDICTAVCNDPIDANGETVVRLTALEGGTTTISFTIDGTNVSTQTQVVCVDPDGFDVLRLPSGITTVGEEAFMGSAAEIIVLPAGCETVASHAFADCPNLKYLLISKKTSVSIAADAYNQSSVIVLYYD